MVVPTLPIHPTSPFVKPDALVCKDSRFSYSFAGQDGSQTDRRLDERGAGLSRHHDAGQKHITNSSSPIGPIVLPL